MTYREPAPSPPKGFRPHMGLAVKLRAAILQLGLDPDKVQFDHDPAIQLRVWDPETGDTKPAANDPRYITIRLKEDHHGKTNKKDKPAIYKTRRLARAQQALADGEKKAKHLGLPKRKINSRGFDKTKSRKMNGKVVPRRSKT
ncbi:MAG: hypothetical protein MI753_12430 [Hyphomicrobiales bacterium]|nr:hypothetical protein [Hyphomicrobiales bacterium]